MNSSLKSSTGYGTKDPKVPDNKAELNYYASIWNSIPPHSQ